MHRLSLFGFAILFGCGGTLDDSSNDCHSDTPPPFASRATLRIDVIDLGEENAKSIGYDLDGRCTEGPETASCRQTLGRSTPDGPHGIDNFFGRQTLGLVHTTVEHPSLEFSGHSYLDIGEGGRGTLYLGRAEGLYAVVPLTDIRMGRKADDALTTVAASTSNEWGEFELSIGGAYLSRWKVWTTGILWARADGHTLGRLEIFPGTSTPTTRHQITLGADEATELTLHDPAGHPLQGTLERIVVFSQNLPGELLRQHPREIGVDGKLVLHGLPDDPNNSVDARSVWIRARDLGLQEFTWWRQADSPAIQRVTMTARPQVTILGRLLVPTKYAADEAVRNVRVSFTTWFGKSELTPNMSWCRGHATATTDATGHFEVSLAAGKLMSVKPEISKTFHLRALLPSAEIMIEPGTTREVDMWCVRTRTLRGVVRHASGTPLAMGFRVTHGNLVRENIGVQLQTRGVFHETFYTDSTGNFSHEVLPGDITLTRQVVPGSNMSTGQLWEKPVGLEDGLIRVPEGTEPFELPAIVIQTVRGRVIDEQQRSLTGGAVVMKAGKTGAGLAGIANDGSFQCDTVMTPDNFSVTQDTQDLMNSDKFADVAIISRAPLVLQLQSPAESNKR